METPQVAGTRLAEAWAVIALDPARAHLFGCRSDGRPGGYRVSRCGTAASLTTLLVGRLGQRLCPACAGARLKDFLA